jgi:V8-like Glu-specific endopeptidase
MAVALGSRAGSAGPGADVAVIDQVSAAGQRAALDMPQWQAALAGPRAPRGIPTAVRFYGVSTVGALFATMGGAGHFCTAAVVRSTVGDLVLTAAHCVDAGGKAGFAASAEFVPGYHNGRQPYGAWAVRDIIVPAGWHRSRDPDLDFAFLVVGRAGGPRIQARTGGLTVGFSQWYHQTIEAIGYNDGEGTPVGCRAKSFRFRTGQMEFYCRNFRSGTSGGPWITGYRAKTGTGTVFGVIGGYEEGGDYDWASYSPYFGHELRVLFGQAEKQAA